MKASRYTFHPLAEVFPLLEDAEFAKLVDDIRRNGLIEPIVVHDAQVLDGRNRYRACIEVGIEPVVTPYNGDDPVSYVVSRNLRRRHLDESQRAMVAAKLTNLTVGDNQHSEGVPIGRGSALLNVSKRSVARAREVRKVGVPELVTAVEAGRVTGAAAADIAALPPDQQRGVMTLAKCELLAVDVINGIVLIDDSLVVESRRPQAIHHRAEDGAHRDAAHVSAGDQEGSVVTHRRHLPNRRVAETFEVEVNGLRYIATIGRFPDGSIGELFLSNHKSNSAADTNARDSGITFSIAVQHGADPEAIRSALSRDSRGRAYGPLGAALDQLAKIEEPPS
jgi:hypothetical protein